MLFGKKVLNDCMISQATSTLNLKDAVLHKPKKTLSQTMAIGKTQTLYLHKRRTDSVTDFFFQS